MTNRNHSINDILNFVIKCDLEEDITFIDEQREAGIKVCDQIYEENDDGKNILKIVTQLSVNEGEICNNGDTEKDYGRRSLNSTGYFISSMNVSTDDKSKTNITTVIGKRDSDFEAVYEASMTHRKTGKQLTYHDSYVRPRKLSHTSSLNIQKTDVIKGAESEPSKEMSRDKPVKPKIKNELLRRLSFGKKKTNMKEIDNLAMDQVFPLMSPSTPKKYKDKPLIDLSRGDVPFKSFEIGSSSGTLKTNKSKNKERSNSKLKSDKKSKTSKIISHKAGKTKDSNATSFSVTIDDITEPTIFSAIVNARVDDDDNLSDTESIFEGESERDPHISAIDMRVVMEPQVKVKVNNRRQSCPNVTCNCHQRKLTLIRDVILGMCKKTDLTEKQDEINEFDTCTNHYRDCPFHGSEFRRGSVSGWRQSQNILHRNCESNSDFNEPITPYLCKSMHSLIYDHEEYRESKIKLSDKQLQFFMTVLCYDNFKEHILTILDSRFTPYHLSRLLYLARTIVRHIGNPNITNNAQSNRIFHFVLQFYREYFYPHIVQHHRGCFVDFLFNCQCDNYDNVE